jgi:hypothetical protein
MSIKFHSINTTKTERSAITPREGMNQFKTVVFILDIDLASLRFSRSSSQVSDDETLTEAHQEGASAQDPSGKIMTPWTFDVKFPFDTQFTIEPLMFAVGDDKNLKMLPQGQHQSALRRYMYKLHVSRPSHLLQAMPVQFWILIQDNISAPSSLFKVFRS